MQEIFANNICEIDGRSKGSASWRDQGRVAYQELHGDGAQMMCGSTLGVWGGLSFYTGSRATSNAAPYLRSPRFTPEKSRLEENVNLSLEQNRS